MVQTIILNSAGTKVLDADVATGADLKPLIPAGSGFRVFRSDDGSAPFTNPAVTIAIDQAQPAVGSELTTTTNAGEGATFQWKLDGANIDGATGANLTNAPEGQVSVVLTWGVHVVESAPVTVAAAAVTVPDAFVGTRWMPYMGGEESTIDIWIMEEPANNGGAITAVQYDVDGNEVWTNLPSYAGPGRYRVTMPAPDTFYQLRVRAVNSAGPGPASNIDQASSRPSSGTYVGRVARSDGTVSYAVPALVASAPTRITQGMIYARDTVDPAGTFIDWGGVDLVLRTGGSVRLNTAAGQANSSFGAQHNTVYGALWTIEPDAGGGSRVRLLSIREAGAPNMDEKIFPTYTAVDVANAMLNLFLGGHAVSMIRHFVAVDVAPDITDSAVQAALIDKALAVYQITKDYTVLHGLLGKQPEIDQFDGPEGMDANPGGSLGSLAAYRSGAWLT